jgi:hypothetical protein
MLSSFTRRLGSWSAKGTCICSTVRQALISSLDMQEEREEVEGREEEVEREVEGGEVEVEEREEDEGAEIAGGGGVTGLDVLTARGSLRGVRGAEEEEDGECSAEVVWGEDGRGRGAVRRGNEGGEREGEGGSAEGSSVLKSMDVR